MKKSFLSGNIVDKVDAETAQWIEQERQLLGIDGYVGDLFIQRNSLIMLRHLWRILRFGDAIKEAEHKQVRLKQMSVLSLFTCKRLHITLDTKFLFMASVL
mmetsp:Transcript_2973/g.5151  ORF Transcript_2973/g.5151 Transcript_2973/m.5151 type:complete len:101 (+) Transcript_2973:67-369(+)